MRQVVLGKELATSGADVPLGLPGREGRTTAVRALARAEEPFGATVPCSAEATDYTRS